MKKSNNSKKIIGGVLLVMAVLVAIFVIASVMESNDFQFGRNNEVTETTEQTESTNETTDDETEPTDPSDDDGTLTYVGNSDMYELLNDRSGTGFFVYIGRPTCPHCQIFEPILRETLQYLDRGMRYFEIDLAVSADGESEMTMFEILEALGVLGVPAVVYMENGEVIDMIGGSNHTQETITSFFDANGGLN